MGDATARVSLPRFCGQLLRQSAAKSVLLLFSSQFNSYEAEESPVERAWFKLETCSCSKRSSLELMAASRAFSFFSCSVSFIICFVLCSSA